MCLVLSYLKVHHQALFARNVLKPIVLIWCGFNLCCFGYLSMINFQFKKQGLVLKFASLM